MVHCLIVELLYGLIVLYSFAVVMFFVVAFYPRRVRFATALPLELLTTPSAFDSHLSFGGE
jgi:hypothetical protein